MPTEVDVMRALREGRRAEPMMRNPYRGLGELAVAWRTGYTQMLQTRIRQSESHKAYYRAHAHLN